MLPRRRDLRRCCGRTVLVLLLCSRANVAATVEAPAIDGKVTYRFYAYPDDGRRDHSVENFLEADVRLRGSLTPNAGYRVELRGLADDAGFTTGVVDPRTEERRRPYLDLPEAVVDWTPTSSLRISAGRQIVNWSGIDEIQPANLMTPMDESDLFHREQLGAYAVTAHADLPGFGVDIAVVPAMFQLTRLPQGRWRFAPDGVALRSDRPEIELDETQAGLRLTTSFDSLEVAILGYVGRDMFPLFDLDATAPVPTAIARHPRVGATGFSASWAFGESWLARSEVLFYGSPDRERDDFFQYVPLSLEYTRGDWRVVLNYLRYDATSRGSGAIDQGERGFYPSFVFGEASWDAGGSVRAKLRGGYDFEKEFALLEPELSLRLWRDVRLSLVAAAIFSGGAKSGYFDLIRHEDRIGIALEYFL